MTGLSIVALSLACCLAIPTIIEGINIARNYSSFTTYDEHIVVGSFIHFNFEYDAPKGINIHFHSRLYNESYDFNKAPIIFSIMLKADFISWIEAGSEEPGILNSTVYYHQADINVDNLRIKYVDNLKINYNDEIYFVIYNDALLDVKVRIDVEIIPWGYIIATVVVGFPFVMFLTIFIIKILSTAHYNGLITIKRKKDSNQQDSREYTNSTTQIERIDGKFCQSCGAPITPKDGQYCPNCGASV